jgi:integrase
VETGLRASELRSLIRASFDLDSDAPTVTVPAAHAKNRRRDSLPLRESTAAMLRQHLATKAPATPAFYLPTKYNMATMLRADAKEAGIELTDPVGRVLDFHSLRHTTGTWLAAAGVHPKVIQRIMRHSTITLTMDRYTHAFKSDEVAALDTMPDLTEPTRQRATGTTDMDVSEKAIANSKA